MKLDNARLCILFAVALVMLSATVVLHTFTSGSKSDFVPGGTLIEGFKPGKVDSIEITKDGDSVKLVRQNGGFYISDLKTKDGVMYPVKNETLASLILDCTGVRLKSLVTADSGVHRNYGLALPEDLDDTFKSSEDYKAATVVRFLDSENNLITGIVQGIPVEMSRGIYVRSLSGSEVYKSEGALNIPYLKTDYVEKKLTTFSEADVKKVAVKLADENYTISKDDKGKIALENVPDGRDVKSSQVESVFKSLAELNLEDIYPISAEVVQGLKWKDNFFQCFMKDNEYIVYGARVVVRDTGSDKEYLVRLQAFGPREDEISTAARQRDNKKAFALNAARQMAGQFNALHRHWVYKVSRWDAEKLCKPIKELLEEIDETKTGTGPEVKPTDPGADSE